MDKRWYPAAVTAMLVGCGGTAFEPVAGTGGTQAIDSGTPQATGGGLVAYYGVQLTGGASAAGGSGAESIGGTSSTGGALATGGKTSTGGTSSFSTAYGPLASGGRATGGVSSVGGKSNTGGNSMGGAVVYGPMPSGGAGVGGKANTGGVPSTSSSATTSIDAGSPATGGAGVIAFYGPQVDYGPIAVGGTTAKETKAATGGDGYAPIYGVH